MNITIDTIIALAVDKNVVLAAQLENSEADSRAVALLQAAGVKPEEARAQRRTFRGEQLGQGMRELGIKDAKSQASGVLEIIVNWRYRQIERADLASARDKLAAAFA